ncbi:hypothetical protein NP014_23810, partial [Salmonella enterica]|nr:hypothetical protein [Salmonella enterica]
PLHSASYTTIPLDLFTAQTRASDISLEEVGRITRRVIRNYTGFSCNARASGDWRNFVKPMYKQWLQRIGG